MINDCVNSWISPGLLDREAMCPADSQVGGGVSAWCRQCSGGGGVARWQPT